jgi:hypothetical protein
LRRAWRTIPELKPMFAHRGQRVTLIDEAGFAQLSQVILLGVAHRRLALALRSGAPRPRIENLLLHTKKFLAFRRRDALGEVLLPNGGSSSDRNEMARALTAHWAATFVETPTSAEGRNAFCLSHVDPIPNLRVPLPSPKAVGHAVRRGSWSAPGPDGIAGAIWRQFASLVTIEFYGIARDVWEGGSIPPDSNAALAAYIPKKGLTRGDHGLQARPAEARPLMLKNSDTKVMCRVLAYSLMPILQDWCHPSQRGFIKGRMPGLGILEIDTAARCIAVCHRLGLIGLFDFSAAFPSISRLCLS